MTGRIWFACCAAGDYEQMLREVRGRDARARLLRFGDVAELGRMAVRFPAGGAGAALFVHDHDLPEAERAVAELSRTGRTEQLLVFVDQLDPACIARLFHAGATEVIAAEGACAPRADTDMMRTERCRTPKIGHPSAPRDGAWGEGGCGPGGPEIEMIERHAARTPLPSFGEDRSQVGSTAPPAGAGRFDDEVPPWVDPSAYGVGIAGAHDLGVVEGGRARATGTTIPMGSSEASAAPATAAEPMTPPVASANGGAADPVRAPHSEPSREDGVGSISSGPAVAPSGTGSPGSSGSLPRHRAPVVTAISGRGGTGKTTLLAAMACSAAKMGLRSAVLDLDLMFGCMHDAFGIEEPVDLGVIARASDGTLADGDIEGSAMRVGPGLTLWGPVAAPEQAELLGKPVEQLISALRGLADVIFVDTSVYWGDAAAAAVAECDRCLVVGTAGPSSCGSAVRAVALASRLGVPRTKMTSVVNRFGSKRCGEEFALRFEMGVSLRSKARIADGGDEVADLLAFGRAMDLAAGKGAFAASARSFTVNVLRELGCPVDPEPDAAGSRADSRPRIRLPWRQREGEAA